MGQGQGERKDLNTTTNNQKYSVISREERGERREERGERRDPQNEEEKASFAKECFLNEMEQ